MELNECVENLEKINRVKTIRTILSNIESYVSSMEDDMTEDDECEKVIDDTVMPKIISRIKYDLETLERYLWH